MKTQRKRIYITDDELAYAVTALNLSSNEHYRRRRVFGRACNESENECYEVIDSLLEKLENELDSRNLDKN